MFSSTRNLVIFEKSFCKNIVDRTSFHVHQVSNKYSINIIVSIIELHICFASIEYSDKILDPLADDKENYL